MYNSVCMRMRKKKWVLPFLENEKEYLIENLNDLNTTLPIYIEIGMGMGDFIVESAIKNPDIFYVGLERVETCVARAIQKAQENKVGNFRVMLADASNIEDLIPNKSIDRIYLHFSDPWPKARQHKRRLTYMPFLSKYEKILKDDGELIFKTDNEGFFNDSLEYFEKSNFILKDINRNYINDDEPMTAYQARFVALGMPIYYAKYELK